MTRKELDEIVLERRLKVTTLDGLDKAIVGLTFSGVSGCHVVYSKKKCISEIKKFGMKKDEAVDFFLNNTVGILRNCGKNHPIIIET